MTASPGSTAPGKSRSTRHEAEYVRPVPPTLDADLLARIRTALDDDLRQTDARIAGLEHALGDFAAAARDSASEDEHDDAAAALALERAQTSSLMEAARAHEAEVRSALARLEAGTYGQCEQCGKAIAPERLEARPIARTCITCASASR